MHDFYYQRLLADPTRFDPRNGNKFIEIVDSTGSDVTVREGGLSEAEIENWIKNEHQDHQDHLQDHLHEPTAPTSKSHQLRLLIGSPEEHHSDAKILPMPISCNTFEAIRVAWSLPTELLRMMLSTLPIAMEFGAKDSSGRAVTGLMMRGGRSRDWNFCLALVHNASTGTTCGIVNGMQQLEIEMLLDCLRMSRKHVRDPFLVPIFLIELKVHYFAVLLEKRALGIEEIEYTTGMRHGFSSDPKRHAANNTERAKRLRMLDLDPITQKLTGVTGTLAFCNMTFNSSLRSLELIAMLRRWFWTSLDQMINVQDQDSETSKSLDRRTAYLKELITGAQAHSAFLQERTRAQVQTVYSMIGQRDNRLNIETAAASTEIASLSLRDNIAMKAIAEDSRNVAVLTRRDSTDMRIIAAVTLVFLPGTFTATLFSASFFDFAPKGKEGVVSKWIWLYCVLTVGFTLMVLGAWWFFSRKGRRGEGMQLREGEKQTETEGERIVEEEAGTEAQGEARPQPMSSRASPAFWAERSWSTGREADAGVF